MKLSIDFYEEDWSLLLKSKKCSTCYTVHHAHFFHTIDHSLRASIPIHDLLQHRQKKKFFLFKGKLF